MLSWLAAAKKNDLKRDDYCRYRNIATKGEVKGLRLFFCLRLSSG